MGFQRKDEAERVYQVLPLRFQKYGLRINLEKSRVVRFARPQGGKNQGEAEAATFDFLGFTHYWGRSRKGQWYVMRKTASTRQAPDASWSDALVSEEPAPAHSRTAPTTLPKAARTLCLLRNHW
jgi:hypothetical protein